MFLDAGHSVTCEEKLECIKLVEYEIYKNLRIQASIICHLYYMQILKN